MPAKIGVLPKVKVVTVAVAAASVTASSWVGPRVQLVTALAVAMLKMQVEIAATAAVLVMSAHSVMSVTVVGRRAVVHALMAHESTATVEAAPRVPALELSE